MEHLLPVVVWSVPSIFVRSVPSFMKGEKVIRRVKLMLLIPHSVIFPFIYSISASFSHEVNFPLFLFSSHIATKQHSLLSIAEFKQNAQELHRPNSFFSVNCTRHNGEELKLYCETCEQLICRDCTMIDHTRPDHRYIFVHEAGASHRMQIVAALKKTVDRIPYVEQLIQAADHLMIDIDNRCRDVEAEVRTCLQQQRYQLQIREERLLDSVRQMRQKKEKIVSAHREALQLYLANVKSSCDFTNRILEEGTAAEVLATKVQVKRQLELLSERQFSEKPSVDGSLHFYANTQALSEIIDSFASVTASSSFPPLCQVVGDGVESGVVGEETHFSIITFDQEGEKRTKGLMPCLILRERGGGVIYRHTQC